MREWRFQLVGDEFDTNGIAELFRHEVRIEKDEAARTELVLDLPFTNNEFQAALDAGKDMVTKLNAIAQTIYGNHENVNVGVIRYKDPSGESLHLVIGAGSIRSRSRIAGVGVVTSVAAAPNHSYRPRRLATRSLLLRMPMNILIALFTCLARFRWIGVDYTWCWR